MNSKKLVISFALAFVSFAVFSQEYAIDKRATWISAMGSFTSQGGDLFESYTDDRASTISIAPVVNQFVSKNLFIGAGLEISSQKQGDYKESGIGIGPHFGFAFGNENSTSFPYIDAGIRYYNMSGDYGSTDFSLNGSDIFIGAGIVFPVKHHVGIAVDCSYHMINLNDSDSDMSESGNIISISVGIVGLLFNQ